jgi:hypothetical protein
MENKQSMTVTTAPLKVPINPKKKDEKPPTIQEKGKRKSTLLEMQEKQYPFPDSDVSKMLDYLLTLKVIELPEMKHPEEANQTNDPKYCKYHRLISHLVERCFVLKDKIMELARQGKITFDDDDVVTSNLAMAITPTTSTFFIQFGSFEPINVEIFSTPKVTSNVLKDNSGTSIKFCHKEPLVVDDEGWTLVTRRRNRKETSLTQSREALRRLRIVKKPTKMNKSKGTETATLPLTEISTQDLLIACYFTRVHAKATPRRHIYICHVLPNRWGRIFRY